ncbi:uncharacterized protein EV422DRAFT_576542 [Fimicolochytrium jonesii]|uniref:uncharacterized protein n=1 Tax=Fimicolochytrium jonesii TaxID=1396493 RepID=UPI0022FF34E3|nr:uncharacterized protein EV422DRAFT_576542 [Fimicolochytrium jonesii]KAI8824062.1 hypothetical protein EV422DRAFT_576542 [Fimicolochytrium jonesii]
MPQTPQMATLRPPSRPASAPPTTVGTPSPDVNTSNTNTPSPPPTLSSRPPPHPNQPHPHTPHRRERLTQLLICLSTSATTLARIWLTLVIAGLVFLLLQPRGAFGSEWLGATTKPASSSRGFDAERVRLAEGAKPPTSTGSVRATANANRYRVVNITVQIASPSTTDGRVRVAANNYVHTTKTTSITAIPAFFGGKIESSVVVRMVVIERLNGCVPFSFDMRGVEDMGGDEVGGVRNREVMNDEVGNRLEDDERGEKGAYGGRHGSDSSRPKSTAARPHAVPHAPTPNTPFILLPRGSCPFDTKVRHAQTAGFAGAIIYNVASSAHPDALIKMQTVDGQPAEDVSIPALFVTSRDGGLLREAAQETAVGGVKVVGVTAVPAMIEYSAPDKVFTQHATKAGENRKSNVGSEPTPNNHYTPDTAPPPRHYPHDWDGFNPTFWGDAFVSAACLILGALGAMAVGASLVLLHNRMFDALGIDYRVGGSGQTTRNLARVVISHDGEMMVERIKLPLRVLTAVDVQMAKEGLGGEFLASNMEKGDAGDDGAGEKSEKEKEKEGRRPISTDCCAICIDNFGVGCRVRELPCRHCFHDTCIDPWLLHHALLCPVCKREIIPATVNSTASIPPPLRRQSSIAIIINDPAAMPPLAPPNTGRRMS